MKITIVADTFGRENNGTTITIRRLIDGLRDRGHCVRVVSPFDCDEEGFYTLPKLNFGVFNGYVAKNGVTLARADREVLRRAIEGSDVVHIVMPFSAGCAAQEICRQLSVPYTTAFHVQAENITAHLRLISSRLAERLVYKIFYHKFYRHARYVHCPSETIAAILKKNGYDMPLNVISNGVSPIFIRQEIARPMELDGKFLIVFVGRYSREKRHDLLVRAVRRSQFCDCIQLVFAGCGPREKYLRRICAGLKNPPVIRFFEKEELVKLLSLADLYVHPSDAEIEAIACLEAISCGAVPIISDSKKSATNAFALSSDNVFSHKSVRTLAERIDDFLSHPEKIERSRRAYLDYAKQFALSNCLTQMEEMFSAAAAEKQDTTVL